MQIQKLSMNKDDVFVRIKGSKRDLELHQRVWDARHEFGRTNRQIRREFRILQSRIEQLLLGVDFEPGSRCLGCGRAVYFGTPYGECFTCHHQALKQRGMPPCQ